MSTRIGALIGLMIVSAATAAGCGTGSGRAPMTVDAEAYEPAAAPDEAAEAAPPPERGAILNPKDELFPLD